MFSTAGRDSPHVYAGAKAILAIKVWEHAYYLKHQSKRADYVDVWWNTRELGQGRGQFQEGDGVAAGHMKGMTLAKRVGRIELQRRHADARR